MKTPIGLLSSFGMLVLLFSACTSSNLTPKAYAQWVTNPANGLSVATNNPSGVYSLQYQPPAFQAVLAQKPTDWNHEGVMAQLAAPADLQFYLLNMPESAAESVPEDYYTYEAQNDLRLVDGKDTLDCEHFHRINTLGGRMSFIVGFPRKATSDQQAKNLLVVDRQGDKPTVELPLSAEALKTHATLLNF